MQALVINLAQESQRFGFQEAQASALGLALERLPAVTVAQVQPPPESPHWQRWQRPLRAVEMATLLSHRRAWQRVAKAGTPMLILEDDAWLMPGAAELLHHAAGLEGIDHLSLETRGRKKILGAPHPAEPALRRLWLDRSGAAAYLLWPEGARKLLARAEAVPALADAVPVECRGLRRWQAAPALAIQIDMAARYGLEPPIAVQSAISTQPRPEKGGLRYRLRRLAAQLRMGLAYLRPGTRRLELRPAIEEGPHP